MFSKIEKTKTSSKSTASNMEIGQILIEIFGKIGSDKFRAEIWAFVWEMFLSSMADSCWFILAKLKSVMLDPMVFRRTRVTFLNKLW